MKKEYITPELEITYFFTDDVVKTSGYENELEDSDIDIGGIFGS